MADNTEALPPTGGPLFSKRKAIADRLGIVMTAEFNAIVREAYGMGMQDARAALAQRQQVPELTDDMLRYAMAVMGTGSPKDAEWFRLFWRFASEAYRTAAPSAQAEPVAWMWQHDETGRTGFVDVWQVENGWQEQNPRLKLIRPLYAAPPAAQAEPQEPLPVCTDKPHAVYVEGYGYVDAKAVRAIELAHGISKKEGST